MDNIYRPPTYSAWWELKHRAYLELAYWRARLGQVSLPAPLLMKSKRLIDIQAQARCRVFVETGTYVGDMTHTLRAHFSELHTIELSPNFFAFASQRLRRYPHIHVHQGDSAVLLPGLARELGPSAFFWLDGHYSGPGTAGSPEDVPIVQELRAIFSRRGEGDVVLIDDIRLFDGSHGYPTVDQLLATIRQDRPGITVEKTMDMLLLR